MGKKDILWYVLSMLLVKQNKPCFILVVEKPLIRTFFFLCMNCEPMLLFITSGIYLVLKYFFCRHLFHLHLSQMHFLVIYDFAEPVLPTKVIIMVFGFKLHLILESEII